MPRWNLPKGESTGALRIARDAWQAAHDELAVIEASEVRILKQVAEAEGDVFHVKHEIQECISAIVESSPGIARIAREAEAAQRTLCRNIQILHALEGITMPPVLRYAACWRDWPADTGEGLRWRTAIDALGSDAFAVLPE